jgi:nucleotide-binding universal stress UspA family protein
LFVPEGATGFVDARSGDAGLRRVLVCVDHDPDPGAAVKLLSAVLDVLEGGAASVTLLHCGAERGMPAVKTPEGNHSWESYSRPGDPVDTILECAQERDADLIVMTTRGHDGFMDALRGSTTERVLRRAECPVLAVPAT